MKKKLMLLLLALFVFAGTSQDSFSRRVTKR